LSAYKNHPIRAQRERRMQVVAQLLSSAMQLHEHCFSAVAGVPVSVRCVVPSLTYRSGVHPLVSVAESVGLVVDSVLTPGLDARCDRRVRAGKFAVNPATDVEGRHVLVIDDVWTTGSNAQSAALALRRAGAAVVSVLVIGRWLSPGNPSTRLFIQSRLDTPYDTHVCPVTGGRCPSQSARRSP
jgi:orotate phosphoribosyltransferase-like protein